MTRLIRYAIALLAVSVLSVIASPYARRQGTAGEHIYVAWYERGPAWPAGESGRKLPNFEDHLAHMHAIESRLLGAGPFVDAPNETMLGMIVFISGSDEDARKLAESDPFVIAKYTSVTNVFRWDVDKLKAWP
jgi:uncharacterized protein YciI